MARLSRFGGLLQSFSPEVTSIRRKPRPYRSATTARGQPLRPAPYRAPGGSRLFLHLAIVAIIGAAVIGTTAFSPAFPGSASGQGPVLENTAPPIAAQFAQTTAERQGLDTSLEASLPASDSLLLAVLSLEASTTSAEVEASLQRILSLGVPQEALPIASLTQGTQDLDEAAESTNGETSGEEEEGAACAEVGSVAYCVYTVVEGDTLSGIAQAVGFAGNESISAAEMLAQSNKPDVTSSDHIEPGQNIRVPREPGILHTVFSSETASELAAEYGTSLDAILNSPYNSIDSDEVLYTGQEIFIPGPTQLPVNEEVEITFSEPVPEPGDDGTAGSVPEASPEAAATEPAAESTPASDVVVPPTVPLLGPLNPPSPTPEPTEEPTATPDQSSQTDEAATPAPESSQTAGGGSFFIWPAAGPVSSYFGPSHPLGIDIDLFDDPDAGIVASRGGTVVFAGGDPCCSYGYYVIVEHENGVRTLYAHLSKILVSEGQEVSQGQLLGLGGHSGYATGNHLHFELRVNGNVVDPLKHLP